MKGYVYLLVHESGTMFKVGKAKDLKIRIGQLEKHWGFFQLDKSFAFKSNDITNLERLIQRLLSEYQITGLDRQKDGYSEFYKISCFEDFLKDSIIFLTKYQKVEIFRLNTGIEVNRDYKTPAEKKTLEKKFIPKKRFFEDPKLLVFDKEASIVKLNVFFYAFKVFESSNFKDSKVVIAIRDIEKLLKKRINWKSTYNSNKLTEFFKEPFSLLNGERVSFASNIEFIEDQRTYILSVSDSFRKYIPLVKQYFNPKKFELFNNINSVYGKLLYLYFSFFKNKHINIREVSISKSDLIKLLSLTDSLERMSNLKNRVIDQSIQSLKSVGMNIDYEFEKNGRSVSGIKFKFIYGERSD